jgi:hypothetical protein
MCASSAGGKVWVQWESTLAIYRLHLEETVVKIHIEFSKSVKLVKMCLNETYYKVCTSKLMFDAFSVQNGLKQRVAVLPFFSTLI